MIKMALFKTSSWIQVTTLGEGIPEPHPGAGPAASARGVQFLEEPPGSTLLSSHHLLEPCGRSSGHRRFLGSPIHHGSPDGLKGHVCVSDSGFSALIKLTFCSCRVLGLVWFLSASS